MEVGMVQELAAGEGRVMTPAQPVVLKVGVASSIFFFFYG